MLTQLKVYKNIIIIGFFVVFISMMYFYVNNLKLEISDLTKKLLISKIEVVNQRRESEMLENALDKQNMAIKSIKVSKQNAIEQLNEWRAKPVEIRYKTLYKTIYKTKVVNSDKCEDIKNIISNVRSIDYDSL